VVRYGIYIHIYIHLCGVDIFCVCVLKIFLSVMMSERHKNFFVCDENIFYPTMKIFFVRR
jgi:hypothetical protein